MPHAVLALGNQVGTAEGAAREFIPGIAPGGSRLGHPTKPALQINDAWSEVLDVDTATNDSNGFEVFLKLSQELGLDPGLLLPVTEFTILGAGVTNQERMAYVHHEQFGAKGSIWAPRVVGLRIVERGAIASFNVRVHIDYEMVDVDWMSWFIMWDWLDNIVNNDLEY